jgi:hypothetical protein
MAATNNEAYILPIREGGSGISGVVTRPYVSNAPQDYQVILPSRPLQVLTVREVIQQLRDEANGTTYLLGSDGLTVIRDWKREEDLQERASVWTIDDK